MIRLFAAVAVPDDIVQALARRQTGLNGARWRTADQMHLTLRFFGEVRKSKKVRSLPGEALPSA